MYLSLFPTFKNPVTPVLNNSLFEVFLTWIFNTDLAYIKS